MLTIRVKEGEAFCVGPDVAIRFVRDSRNRLGVQIAAPKQKRIRRLGPITDQQIYEVQNGRSALEFAPADSHGSGLSDAGQSVDG